MEVDLRNFIIADTTLAPLVTAGGVVGVYWSSIPQAAADPNIVLYKITGVPGLHMQGSDELDSALVQMNIRALTYASMIAVRNALVARLNAYRGVQGATDFRLIKFSDERQNSEKPGTVLYFTDQLDFDVWSTPAD